MLGAIVTRQTPFGPVQFDDAIYALGGARFDGGVAMAALPAQVYTAVPKDPGVAITDDRRISSSSAYPSYSWVDNGTYTEAQKTAWMEANPACKQYAMEQAYKKAGPPNMMYAAVISKAQDECSKVQKPWLVRVETTTATTPPTKAENQPGVEIVNTKASSMPSTSAPITGSAGFSFDLKSPTTLLLLGVGAFLVFSMMSGKGKG